MGTKLVSNYTKYHIEKNLKHSLPLLHINVSITSTYISDLLYYSIMRKQLSWNEQLSSLFYISSDIALPFSVVHSALDGD